MRDPTQRFSSRVDNYVNYRPSYPAALITAVGERCGLGRQSQVADMGAGTGILTALLLETGASVVAIEPNPEMRAAADSWLGGRPGYRSLAGRAEDSGLASASCDLITAGQAFHWFEPAATRREWQRVLRPGGWVAIVWNLRQTASSPWMADYAAALRRWGTDDDQVAADSNRTVDPAVFGPAGFSVLTFANSQRLDLAGLLGRAFSSSYTPEPGQAHYAPLREALSEIFARHAQNGTIELCYTTRLYLGQLDTWPART